MSVASPSLYQADGTGISQLDTQLQGLTQSR